MVRGTSAEPPSIGSVPGRLDLLKALGDNTRFAIYLELARSSSPLATADVAEALGLHANTVRPHLERMREVGLLEVRPSAGGGVGRPQHLYSLAPDAPALGLEPPAYPVLAAMLLQVAVDAGIRGDAATEAGRQQGRRLAAGFDARRDPFVSLHAMHEQMGFDPESIREDDTATVFFAHCPFAELAASNPDLVCSLHRGLIEGFVEQMDTVVEVTDFHDRAHREPCLAMLSTPAVVTGDDVH